MDEYEIKQKEEVLSAISTLEDDIFRFTRGTTCEILIASLEQVRDTFETNYPWVGMT